MHRLLDKTYLRHAVVLLVLGSTVACTGSRYYAVDRRQDNTDYANRIECPPNTLPVCFERGGEIVQCRCERDDRLGEIY